MRRKINEELSQKIDNIINEYDYVHNFAFSDLDGTLHICEESLYVDDFDEGLKSDIDIYEYLDGYKYTTKDGKEKAFDANSENRDEEIKEVLKFIFKDRIEDIIDGISIGRDSFLLLLKDMNNPERVKECIEELIVDNSELRDDFYNREYLEEIADKGLENYSEIQTQLFYQYVEEIIKKFNELMLIDKKNKWVYEYNINILDQLIHQAKPKVKFDEIIYNIDLLPIVNIKIYDLIDDKYGLIKKVIDSAEDYRYEIDEIAKIALFEPNRESEKEDSEKLFEIIDSNKKYINNNGVPYTKRQVSGYVHNIIENGYINEEYPKYKFDREMELTEEEKADEAAKMLELRREFSKVAKRYYNRH